MEQATALKEIKFVFKRYEDNLILIKEKLTGFGDIETCILCKKAGNKENEYTPDCNKCIYVDTTRYMCNSYINSSTYNMIRDASTPKELFIAYKKREAYINKIIKYAERITKYVEKAKNKSIIKNNTKK